MIVLHAKRTELSNKKKTHFVKKFIAGQLLYHVTETTTSKFYFLCVRYEFQNEMYTRNTSFRLIYVHSKVRLSIVQQGNDETRGKVSLIPGGETYPVGSGYFDDQVHGLGAEEPAVAADHDGAAHGRRLNGTEHGLHEVLRVVRLLEHLDGFA